MNRTLITTSLFSAVFAEEKKDYIDIIMPFVEYILANNYSKGDEISSEMINDNLCKEFYFNNLPLNVSTSIIIRLLNRKKIIKEKHQYFLCYDFRKEADKFAIRKVEVSAKVEKVISRLNTYINKELQTYYSTEETESFLIDFLNVYGYDTYFRSTNSLNIPAAKETTRYLIGKYIKEANDQENKNDFYELLTIIEGFMIADAVYLQVDLKNKVFLKDMVVYLDGPFVLRVLGLKNEFENKAAKELINLLRKFGAKIKIFKHTREEIIRILTYYMNHKDEILESRIEKFDALALNAQEIYVYINEIEQKIISSGIVIEDFPEFIVAYSIDEEKLSEKLNSRVPNHKKGTTPAVETDVLSVRAINILRKGKNYQRVEDCKYIFLTTYYFLRVCADEIRENAHNQLIGPVITDIDLTTILWMKDLATNKDLPKIKLVANALSALQPTTKLVQKTKQILESLESEGVISEDLLGERLGLQYLIDKDYIDQFKNDDNKVTKETVGKIINNDKDQINRLIKDKDQNIQKIEKYRIHKMFINEQNGLKLEKKIKGMINVVYWISIVLIAIIIYVLPLFQWANPYNKILSGTILLLHIVMLIFPKINFPRNKIKSFARKKKFKYIEEKNNELFDDIALLN